MRKNGRFSNDFVRRQIHLSAKVYACLSINNFQLLNIIQFLKETLHACFMKNLKAKFKAHIFQTD